MWVTEFGGVKFQGHVYVAFLSVNWLKDSFQETFVIASGLISIKARPLSRPQGATHLNDVCCLVFCQSAESITFQCHSLCMYLVIYIAPLDLYKDSKRGYNRDIKRVQSL